MTTACTHEMPSYMFRILGKGLGCVLIKSTLGPGKTQKGWKLGREGYTGATGDKKGSSGGSLVATPDCKTAVLGSNPALPSLQWTAVLRWAAIWDGTSL